MTRADAFESLREPFDVLVIGGGATGLGIAVDAVTRGFRTALVDANDFAQATSSRATKLVHGGVRYLASGNLHLVYEALHERAVMLRNAPHLVKPQAFVLPTYKRLDLPFYSAGLLLYGLMAGRSTMGPTRVLGRSAVAKRIPNIETSRLTGGVLYHDGQFNDARFALALARTAADHGASVLNYARCTRLIEANGRLTGALIRDEETGAEYHVNARVIFNATGIFTDELRRMDDKNIPPILSVSRGSHIMVRAGVLGGNAGVMVPKTADGRVIFAIPWQGRVLVGTTDLAAPKPVMEPGHTSDEIAFLIETLNPFLAHKISEADILAIFSGLRPLVSGKTGSTAKLSREHMVDISAKGLITVAGGKWTTYRRMAEDALDFAAKQDMLPKRECITAKLQLHGAVPHRASDDPYVSEYGSDAQVLQGLVTEEPALAERIDASLPYTAAEAVYAVRSEMARTVEDVLSRRTRALLLDAAATLRAAPAVAALIRKELGHSEAWESEQVAAFTKLVNENYCLP